MEGKISYVNPWAWYRWIRPHTLLNKPWRPEGDPGHMNEKLAKKLRKEITDVKYDREITKAGVIVLGPPQSGKSSFINSLLSCTKGRISMKTISKSSDESVTVKMLKVTGKELNFWLCDTMGMNASKYVTDEELKSILEGKLEHGYMFEKGKDISFSTQNSTASDENQGATEADIHADSRTDCGSGNQKDTTSDKKETGANTKIQIAVFVLAADTLKDVPSNPKTPSRVRTKIMEALKILECSEIQPLYILTRVDVICHEVRKDPKMIFQSRAVQEMVKKAQHIFKCNENVIFPVVNYVKEVQTNVIRDIPLLFALRHIVQLASDHAEDIKI